MSAWSDWPTDEDRADDHFDDEPRSCLRCGGTGEVVTCIDDLCHNSDGVCIHGHGDGYGDCPDCKGKGELGADDVPTVG